MGLWSDPANWTAGVPLLPGDQAVFTPGSFAADASLLVSDPTTTLGTLTYDSPVRLAVFASLFTFDGSASNAQIEVNAGGILLNDGDFILATDADLFIAPGAALTVGQGVPPAASLGGPGGLNLYDGGDLHLNAANTYNGVTDISHGVLHAAYNDSLGAGVSTGGGATVIHAQGTLNLVGAGVTLPNEKIIFEGGAITLASEPGSDWRLDGPFQMNSGVLTGGDWVLAGPVIVNGGSLAGGDWLIQGPVLLDATLAVTGGNGIVTSAVSGDMGVHLNAPGGMLRLARANSYAGQTLIENGTLRVTDNLALGIGTGIDADGTRVMPGGRLDLSGGRQIANEKLTLDGGRLEGISFIHNGPLSVDGGTVAASNWTLNGGVELVGNLTIQTGPSTGKINGVIHGPGDIRIVAGQTLFSATNTYTGQTIIDAGELGISKFSQLGAGTGVLDDATIVNTGGTLRVTGAAAGPADELIVLNGGTLTGGGVFDTPILVEADSVINSGTYTRPFTGSHDLRVGDGVVNIAADNAGYAGTITVEIMPGAAEYPKLITTAPGLTLPRLNLIRGWLDGDDFTITEDFTWEAALVAGKVTSTGQLTLRDDPSNNDKPKLDGELINAGRMVIQPNILLESRGYPYPNNGSILNQAAAELELQSGAIIRSLPTTNLGLIIGDAPDAPADISRIDNHGTVHARHGELQLGRGDHTGTFIADAGTTLVIGYDRSDLSTFSPGTMISGAGDVVIQGDADIAATIDTTGRLTLVGYDMNYLPGTVFGPNISSWRITGRNHRFNTGTTLTFNSPVEAEAGFYGTDTLVFEDALTLGDSDFRGPLKVYLNGETDIQDANSAGARPSIYQAELFNAGHFYVNAQLDIGDGSVLHNLPTGHIEWDRTGTSNFAVPMHFDNQGLFTSSGYSSFYAQIFNRGTLRILDSELRMGRYHGLDGSGIEILSGASIELSGGDEFLAGSMLTGEGEVEISVGNGEDPVAVRSGAVFKPTKIRFYSHSGHLLIEDGADFAFNELAMPDGGIFELYADVQIDNSLSIESGTIKGDATIAIDSGSYFYRANLDGISVTNRGASVWFDRVNLLNGAVWKNRAGAVTETSYHLIVHGSDTSRIENAGTFYAKDDGYSVRIHTDIHNTGTLILEGDVSLEESDIHQTAGVTRFMPGSHVTTYMTNGITLDGGLLEGSGVFEADIHNNAATLAPGSSAGTLTIDGDYTQLVNALLRVELGDINPDDHDRLIVTGVLDAAGTFELSLLVGFVPQLGDTFDVLDFGSLQPGSAFDRLLLPRLPGGRGWDTSDLLVTGEVRVVPEPFVFLPLVIGLIAPALSRHADFSSR